MSGPEGCDACGHPEHVGVCYARVETTGSAEACMCRESAWRQPKKTTRVRITFETDAVFGDKPEATGVEEMQRAYASWLPRARGLKVEVVPEAQVEACWARFSGPHVPSRVDPSRCCICMGTIPEAK